MLISLPIPFLWYKCFICTWFRTGLCHFTSLIYNRKTAGKNEDAKPACQFFTSPLRGIIIDNDY